MYLVHYYACANFGEATSEWGVGIMQHVIDNVVGHVDSTVISNDNDTHLQLDTIKNMMLTIAVRETKDCL